MIDELFDGRGAAAMVELCERFGRYRMYAEHEQLDTDIGRGLSQRHDASSTSSAPAGSARAESPRRARGAHELLPRGVRVRTQPSASTASSRSCTTRRSSTPRSAIHGRPVIEPAIAYANLMVPGQELAVHTDVPEFRGANRKVVPQWLLVVMHHSGLFDEYRMPIATGDRVVPRLRRRRARVLARRRRRCRRDAIACRYNTAHGARHRHASSTASTASPTCAVASFRACGPGMTLDHADDRTGSLHTEPTSADVAEYDWDELRFSVSWKAYCFRDEAERDTWRDHATISRSTSSSIVWSTISRAAAASTARSRTRRARPADDRRVHPLSGNLQTAL